SLRTLYVACTRAQDYLVLSSALPPSFRPSSPWMLTLAERFDLRSGACLADGVPPERVPKVRVTETGEDSEGAAAPRDLPAAGALPGSDDGFPGPVPPGRAGQQLFGVGELEALLERGNEEPGAFAWQFDAEDGSDRNAWPTRRERLGPAPPDR